MQPKLLFYPGMLKYNVNDASMNLRGLFEFITWPIFISQNMRD